MSCLTTSTPAAASEYLPLQKQCTLNNEGNELQNDENNNSEISTEIITKCKMSTVKLSSSPMTDEDDVILSGDFNRPSTPPPSTMTDQCRGSEFGQLC